MTPIDVSKTNFEAGLEQYSQFLIVENVLAVIILVRIIHAFLIRIFSIVLARRRWLVVTCNQFSLTKMFERNVLFIIFRSKKLYFGHSNERKGKNVNNSFL